MDLTTVFANIEASQTAKSNGATQLANDQAKAAAIAQAIGTDTTNLTDLTAKADSDIQAGIAALQGLLSTAPPPAPPALPAPPAA
jgi:hypothetical protein